MDCIGCRSKWNLVNLHDDLRVRPLIYCKPLPAVCALTDLTTVRWRPQTTQQCTDRYGNNNCQERAARSESCKWSKPTGYGHAQEQRTKVCVGYFRTYVIPRTSISDRAKPRLDRTNVTNFRILPRFHRRPNHRQSNSRNCSSRIFSHKTTHKGAEAGLRRLNRPRPHAANRQSKALQQRLANVSYLLSLTGVFGLTFILR